MKAPVRIRLCAVVVLTAAVPVAAAAQQDSLRRYGVDTLQVTTKRYPALRTEIPQKIEVITERDIRRTPATEIVDVLKKQNAVDVVQYPGLLSGIGIRGFRPEFSWINQRTLILIDGRPAGVTNLSTLDMNAVERIEILKGPASSLYGSSAMGGAVNLITRRSTGGLSGSGSVSYGTWRTLEVTGRVGGRVLPRVDMDLSFSRFSRDSDYRLGDGNLLRDLVGREEAIKIFPDSLHPVPEVGDGEVIPNTQYTFGTVSGRVGVQLGGGLRADARGEWFRADDVEGPPDLFAAFDPGQRKNLERRGGEVALSAVRGRHSPLLRVFAGREDSDFFNLFDPDPFISFTSRVNSGGVQLQDAVQLGEQALTAGIDLTRMEATSEAFSAAGTRSRPFSPNAELSSLGVFAESRLVLLDGQLSGTLGGRYDRIGLEITETPLRPDLAPERETFDIFNPSLGLQYAPVEGVRVHGTVGRAFVSPDAVFKAGLGLSSTTTGGAATITLGNPELDAERSLTYDIGIGVSRPQLGIDVDVTYFHTTVDDRIGQVTAVFPAASRPRTAEGVAVGSVTTWVNASDATMSGIEWRLGYDLGALSDFRYSLRVFGNATHLLKREETVPALSVDAARFAGRTDFRPEEVTGALVFGEPGRRDIRNVATRTITYGAEYDDLRRFSARLTGRYVGKRLDVDFSDFSNITDIRYPAFMTLDLTSTLRLGRAYSVSLLVANLTDENYYEKRGFNLPGRSVRLRLTADF
jgi:vitamin B12 transporter